jgi:hypothetical protein
MRKFVSIILITCICCSKSNSQNVPNLANESVMSGNTSLASELSSIPINVFTGIPQIGIPIYSYSNPRNGLSLRISLDYFAGGIHVEQSAGTEGLGWYLNAGGAIVRTVRGAPDDMPSNGYLYTSAIPTDYRSNGDKYFFDTLDAQQDIFQYNFNGRSGKFFIGKNGQIVVVPNSKLRILPTFGTGGLNQRIIAFRIITENGTKYDFNYADSTIITTKGADSTLFRSAYSGKPYYSAWYLGDIIAPFNTDTIKFNYSQQLVTDTFAYPQMAFVRNSDAVRTKIIAPHGINKSVVFLPTSIIFPEKTSVSFIYLNNLLSKIMIGDTTFKYGYLLDYTTSWTDPGDPFSYPIRPLLSTLTPYFPHEKNFGYSFSYHGPYFSPNISNDSLEWENDYWGFWNGKYNGSNAIPNVNGYTWGADRRPDTFALASCLRTITLPTGGTITYDYEPNDHYPYTKTSYKLSTSPTTTSSSTISLNQVFDSKHQLTFILDSTVSRSGSTPISGTGNLIVYIKNTGGTITYASDTISLYNLFYEGMATFSFNVPNGSYLLSIPAVTGTTITGSFPVNIYWENKIYDNSRLLDTAGGIRVKTITKRNGVNDPSPTIEQFKYVNADGTSSGFLGDIPKYFYYYLETVNYGGLTTTSYTNVGSDPINTMDYAEGSPVGYSRVEVYKGSTTHNLGKTVYEFTNLQDINAGAFTETFPYAPEDLRDWGIGQMKKFSVYDSLGILVNRTVNNYTYDSSLFVNNNFKSIKLGNTYTYVNGDPNSSSSPRMRTYIVQDYYPVSGHLYLASSFDTLFQSNGSQNTSYRYIYYDTNYNVTKIVTPYDRNRGLQFENRFYYPYNYTITGSVKTFRDSSIITPVIDKESWITGDANPRIISGTITDYLQTANYMKPLATYFLQSNAPLSQTTIGTFSPSSLNRNTTYFVKQNSFVSYDSRGNLLQEQNTLSGVNNSVIMDYGKQYPVAKISNAAYGDVAYTSFESDGSGNWTISSSLRDTLNSITGKKSYNLSNGNITKSGLISGTSYYISVWAKSGTTVNVNGSALSTVLATQQGWNMYATNVTGVTSVIISGAGQIDELRLHPKNANMITYTYDPMIGVTSTTDANNTIVYSEYDNQNRLKLLRDKDKNILKRYDYSDTKMTISTTPNWYTTKSCIDNYGHFDSTTTDDNPYSPTYKVTYSGGGIDYCLCGSSGNYPDYKYVNGACEQGQKCYISSTWGKYNNVWQWQCVYHYQWSDGSSSGNYYEYHSSSCALGCPPV